MEATLTSSGIPDGVAVLKSIAALTEDDQFLSNPKTGVITQTVPSIDVLMGVEWSKFDSY